MASKTVSITEREADMIMQALNTIEGTGLKYGDKEIERLFWKFSSKFGGF